MSQPGGEPATASSDALTIKVADTDK